MSDEKLWCVVKGYDFGDIDSGTCAGFGGVYHTRANSASFAANKVDAFLKRHPECMPNSPMNGTTSMSQDGFLCVVGCEPVDDIAERGVSVEKRNILLYNNAMQRRVFRDVTRNACLQQQSPVVSFDDAIIQFLQYPLKFRDLPETIICNMKIGAVEKSRDSVQDELNRRFSAPSYQSFVRCVQEENRAMDNEFIDELPEHDRNVVRADIELAELKSFEFMGVGRQMMCLANGDAVFDKAFPEVQYTLQAARERSNPVDDKVVEHDGF